jgi:alcohol dehydrogenase class IV
MAHAAFLSGVALANSGLGFAHGVAAALGAVCDVPHGMACAAMLPAALRLNREVAQTGVAAIGRLWAPPSSAGLDDESAADLAIATIDSLVSDLNVPTKLRALGVEQSQIEELIPASRGSSMNGNPRDVSDDELRQLLQDMW